MTDLVYVVIERGWEYNDETYDMQEGGNAVLAFPTREDAEREVRKRTRQQFLAGNLAEFVNLRWENEGLARLLGFDRETHDMWDFDAGAAFQALSPEDQERAIDMVGDVFYYTQDVPLAAA